MVCNGEGDPSRINYDYIVSIGEPAFDGKRRGGGRCTYLRTQRGPNKVLHRRRWAHYYAGTRLHWTEMGMETTEM